jgi:hypothetical protein
MHRAMLERLREEWEGLTFQPGEQVKDFGLRLTNLMEQMAHNGDTDLIEERPRWRNSFAACRRGMHILLV